MSTVIAFGPSTRTVTGPDGLSTLTPSPDASAPARCSHAASQRADLRCIQREFALPTIQHDKVVADAVHLREAQLHAAGAQGWLAAGSALLAAVAGSTGTGALVAGAGWLGGRTSGPLLPQPARVAKARQNGSSKNVRRMTEVPQDHRSIATRAAWAAASGQARYDACTNRASMR